VETATCDKSIFLVPGNLVPCGATLLVQMGMWARLPRARKCVPGDSRELVSLAPAGACARSNFCALLASTGCTLLVCSAPLSSVAGHHRRRVRSWGFPPVRAHNWLHCLNHKLGGDSCGCVRNELAEVRVGGVAPMWIWVGLGRGVSRGVAGIGQVEFGAESGWSDVLSGGGGPGVRRCKSWVGCCCTLRRQRASGGGGNIGGWVVRHQRGALVSSYRCAQQATALWVVEGVLH